MQSAKTTVASPGVVRLLPARIGAILLCASAPLEASAGFFEDTRVKLEARNVYFNRDFRDGPGQSARNEWAQGFILDVISAYTPGPVGFGLDLKGMLGVRLDSSPARSGSGLLPKHADGTTPAEYGKLGVTGKVKAFESELKIGSLFPRLPVLTANDGRILPQTFLGGVLQSKDIARLTLQGGRFDQVKHRNSTDFEDMELNDKNKRFRGVVGDHLDFVGADYAFTKGLTGRYYFSRFSEVYQQHFVGLLFEHALGPGKLSADLRVAISSEEGEARAGDIDNLAANGMLGYGIGPHKFRAGWQQMSGDSAFPYVDGSNPYLVNFVQINDFAGADERSWQLRYDLNFKRLGVPGLTFMTRYISGDKVVVAGRAAPGSEWERDTEFKYVIQSGPLKDLSLRWRNASYRSDFARDADENRLILSYVLKLW